MTTKSVWPSIQLGAVLNHRKEFITIDDLNRYKRCRVQLHAQGVVLRDEVEGASIKTKTQQVCRSQEFLVAEIDAKMGGFGIVPPELDGSIVSSHYFLFVPDPKRLDPAFLGYYSKTPQFREQVAARGTTNYAAIRPGHVLGYTMPVPPLDQQRRIVEKINGISAKIDESGTIVQQADDMTKGMLLSAYRRIVSDAPRRPFGEVAPLIRRPAVLDPAGVYPQVSVRSFGRGAFHNPPLLGSEITWEKPHLVKEGDILISNIKAWEGAIAVAHKEDGGRYGSHRYLTFVPNERMATASFLCFHLLTEGLFHVGEASPGSADRNRTLSAKAMLAIRVPVPAIDKQVWFDNLQAKAISAARIRADAGRIRNALIPSILDRAFKGEL
jgi:type I restriction enzyme, S subunit